MAYAIFIVFTPTFYSVYFSQKNPNSELGCFMLVIPYSRAGMENVTVQGKVDPEQSNDLQ